MLEEKSDNFFGCFVSGPAVYYNASVEEKENALKLGEEFRSYIWGENGITKFLRNIKKSELKLDFGIILFQFKINPIREELQVFKEIERFRSKEKSIGINTIVNSENFFLKSNYVRKEFLGKSILDKFELVKPVLVRNKILEDFNKIDLKLLEIIDQYMKI